MPIFLAPYSEHLGKRHLSQELPRQAHRVK